MQTPNIYLSIKYDLKSKYIKLLESKIYPRNHENRLIYIAWILIFIIRQIICIVRHEDIIKYKNRYCYESNRK